jgi:hypothetical protein
MEGIVSQWCCGEGEGLVGTTTAESWDERSGD